MRLLHYSAVPFTGPLKDRSDELHVEMKPHGLWFSVEGEDDWKSWCEAENFRPDALKCVTEITLYPDAAILMIEDPCGIDAVTQKWGRTLKEMKDASNVEVTVDGHLRKEFGPMFIWLDWMEIARTFDGIIIAPYMWSRRLDGNSLWYYGWDCASGCIWNPRAIEQVNPC